jgi:hypothetical protein
VEETPPPEIKANGSDPIHWYLIAVLLQQELKVKYLGKSLQSFVKLKNNYSFQGKGNFHTLY